MAEDKSKAALNKAKDFEKRADTYNASQIQVLGGLEAVRKRPGMYIGSTSSQGLHHLVWEIIDNSIDERLAGFATKIEITVNEDGSVTVQDDGRGIPVDIQAKTGRPALETVFTVLHAGGKFGGGGYKVSGGLHGVGASVVNALSTKLEVTVMRDGKKYAISFDHGRVVGEMKQVGTVPLEEHGTIVRFYPDPDIFTETITFDDKILKNRIRELAFLNKGLKLTFTDKRKESAETDVYHFEGGIKEYVAFLNKGQEVLFDEPIYVEGNYEGIDVEVALQYTNGYKTTLMTALFRHAKAVQRSVPALYAAVGAYLAEVVQPFHLIKAVVFNKGAVMHHVHIKRRIIGNGMVNLAHLLQLAAHEHNKVNVALLAFGIGGTERIRPAV